MIEVFGAGYASLYDDFYSDHSYDKDVNQIVQLIDQHLGLNRNSILDFGCGTGHHVELLTKRGFEVVGVDLSPAMLKISKERNPSVKFELGDVRTHQIIDNEDWTPRKFDTVLMMSAVLGYQHSNSDVLQTFHNVRNHLKDGGLYVFSVWYGPTVLTEKPGQRFKTIKREDGDILRHVNGHLDAYNNTCHCTYNWWKMGQKEKHTETHVVRYFFPLELSFLLQMAKFNILKMGAAQYVWRDITTSDWHLMVVCRAS